MSALKKELKTQIGKGNLDTVIKTLVDKTEGQLHNDVVQLSSRLKKFKRQQNQGILSHSEINLQQNQLTTTLLDLVDELPEDEKETIPVTPPQNVAAPIPTPPTQKVAWKKWLTIAAAVLASLAAIAELSGYSLRDTFTTSAPQEALTLTVKVRTEEGTRPLKNEGDLVIDYGNGTQTIPIDKEGKIDLREIPVRLRGNPVSIILEHPKYEVIPSVHSKEAKQLLNGNPITLPIQMKSIFGTIIGRVKSRDGKQTLENVAIEVDGETSTTDVHGKIWMQMPKQKWKESYTVHATYQGETKSETYYPTLGDVEIRF